MDFKGLLEDIISFLPVSRQILLFSATFPISVKEFKVRYGILIIELFEERLLEKKCKSAGKKSIWDMINEYLKVK